MSQFTDLLKKEKASLEKRLHHVQGLLEDATEDGVKSVKKMSADTKRKLSEAAKARWAKVKKAAKG
jgi:hypothetical protein